jgi:uncharacterized protein YraI
VIRQFRKTFLSLFIGLALSGGALAQDVLFKNFSEVQVTGAVTAASSANSHALIMYNADYAHPGISDLPVTANDAQAVKKLFEGMGYPAQNITLVENASKEDMELKVFEFANRLTKDSSVVVYYSGHGISFKGDARNYIVPVDMNPEVGGGARDLRERLFKKRSVNFNDDVLGTIKIAGPKGVVVFYDACRNSPIGGDGSTKSVGAEASFVPAKIQGTAMFYSARAGQTSLAALSGNDDTQLSVYTRVLVSKLAKNPTMRLSDLHATVQSDVSSLARDEAGGHAQHPVFEDELDYSRSDHNEFCLATVMVNGVARCTGRDQIIRPDQVDQPKVETVAVSPTPTGPGTGGVVSGGKADTERLYWESVKDSNDPREVQSYLDLYPNGFFAPLAKLRVQKLREASKPEPKPEVSQVTAAEAAFWNSGKDMDDPDMIRLYIQQYPNGQFRPLAEARIAQIQEAAANAGQAAALRAYQTAQSQDTQAAYLSYLNRHPNGEHVSAVRSHLQRMTSLYQPSWCRSGSALNPAEGAICDNYELGRLDSQLNVAYSDAKAYVSSGDQRDWRIFTRDNCGSNVACLTDTIRSRIEHLYDVAQNRPAPQPQTLQSRYPACPARNGRASVTSVSTGDWLNVRSGSNSKAGIVGALAYNTSGVTISSCTGGWCYVQHGCIGGWAFGKYLNSGSTSHRANAFAGTYKVVDHPMNELLNVRTGPGTEFQIVGELAPNATGIKVTDCQRVKGWKMRWCTVEHSSGAAGWAYGQYLANNWGQKPQ